MNFEVSPFEKALTNVNDIVMICIAGVLAYVTKGFKEYLKKKKADRLSRSIEHNSVIREMLSEIRGLYDCDRVKLFQFHNGDFFLSGESSMKTTMTHYVLKLGVSVPSTTPGTHQNIQTSHLLHTLRSMKNGVYFMDVNDEETDPLLVYLFSCSGTNSAIFAPIRDVRGNWLGFICCTWLDHNESGDNQNNDIIMNYADKIGLLMSKKF